MVSVKYIKPLFDLPSTEKIKIDFYANTMKNNTHIQIVGTGSTYVGSLIDMESDIPEAFFGFS